MKFQMLSDFHAGNISFAAGTIVDWLAVRDIPVPWPTAKALDQEALDALAFYATEENFPKLQFAPGLKLPYLGYPAWHSDEVIAETRKAEAKRKEVEDFLASLEKRYGPTKGD
jgi:hypothetical protein